MEEGMRADHKVRQESSWRLSQGDSPAPGITGEPGAGQLPERFLGRKVHLNLRLGYETSEEFHGHGRRREALCVDHA